MIKLWLDSENDDIVTYIYQAEDSAKGTILYSKKRQATKIDDDILGNFPKMYYNHLHSRIMKFGENNKFPKEDTIAWY